MLGAYLVQLLHGCGQFGYSQAQTVKQRKSENKRAGGGNALLPLVVVADSNN